MHGSEVVCWFNACYNALIWLPYTCGHSPICNNIPYTLLTEKLPRISMENKPSMIKCLFPKFLIKMQLIIVSDYLFCGETPIKSLQSTNTVCCLIWEPLMYLADVHNFALMTGRLFCTQVLWQISFITCRPTYSANLFQDFLSCSMKLGL
jgi:hypothetical protein